MCINNEKGLTLVELLCVLVFIGIIVTIATPALSRVEEKRNLDIAARTLAIDIRETQQKAITKGWSQLIEFRSSMQDYRIRDGVTNELKIVKLPEGISYRSNNFPRVGGYRLLVFFRTGAPNNGGTVALINESGDTRFIIVTPATGRVRIDQNPPTSW